MKDGFLLIDKEVDWTSRDICNKVQRLLNTKKVGHTGTLDPFATGLLMVSVNKGTKAGYFLDDLDKTYIATLKLGTKTSTADLTGEIIEEKSVPELNLELVQKALDSQIGEQDQVPPMTSAIKVNGVKLYELAHSGIEIERKSRRITIKSIKLLDFNDKEITFECSVSKGTYIRTLGETIAEALGTVGHLVSLRRTRVGPYKIEDSINVMEASEDKLFSIQEILEKQMPIVEINDSEIPTVKNGANLENINKINDGNVLVVDKNRNALAIYYINGDKMKCVRGLW